MPTIANSSWMDFAGYGVSSQATAEGAWGIKSPKAFKAGDPSINVALILERNNDPTDLLSESWGQRQQTLQDLNASGKLWSTYGADPAVFKTVAGGLAGAGLTVLDASNSNYVTSAESRTVWAQIDSASDFSNLFGTTLYYSSDQGGLWYWDGNLSLPSAWKVAGLWFDTNISPPPTNMAPGVSATLKTGPQSPGNSATAYGNDYPQVIAGYYDFPLLNSNTATATIGLIEPSVGSYLPGDTTGATFQARLNGYLAKASVTGGTGSVYVQGVTTQNQSSGERSLDVGVVAATDPNSNIGLYVGSGTPSPSTENAVFTAVQSAIWDTVHNPPVTSNSWGDAQSMTPGSPFYQAYWGLYVDAALRNQTSLIALGDGGSGNQTGNGLTSVETNVTSPYNILVGGTSLSTLAIAQTDPTLTTAQGTPPVPPLVSLALAGDRATIWQLVSGGLTAMPSAANSTDWLVETVWNGYVTLPDRQFADGDSYFSNNTSSGGVDTTQPVPWYQAAFGLSPTTVNPGGGIGRGTPDVTILSGNNTWYKTPTSDMLGVEADSGTSAASPLWASLIAQIDAIFQDQGLPNLGFMTDLLYKAAAIAPAAFNDVTIGNNISSYSNGGDHYSNTTPTGLGYYAGPGYDLVSGLGSPNGTLLARALSAIGHSQMYFSTSVPDLVDPDGSGGWTSGTDQVLMVQAMSASGASVGVAGGIVLQSPASATYAWTSQFAEQSLQQPFSSALAIMFDKQAQGGWSEATFSAGAGVAVSINGTAASMPQATLTTDAGFADFMTAQGAVRLARGIAVAETAGGADDQTAIVRVRQVGMDSLSVSFYRVDDYTGAIGALHPGDAGYAAAAQARAYTTASGATTIAGPGYGQFAQAAILHVNAGDLVAQTLTDVTWGNSYWGFAQANESAGGQKVGHLWQYGLNTFGWEDTYGGGDRDYNDLVVQLDFTSTAGHGYLVL